MISRCEDSPRGPSESGLDQKAFTASTFTGAFSEMTSHRIPPLAGAARLHKACWENRACVFVFECVYLWFGASSVPVMLLSVVLKKTHRRAGAVTFIVCNR